MKRFFILIPILFLIEFINGQGCSDAGFCSIHSFKPGGVKEEKTKLNSIKAGVFYGQASHSINATGNYLEYNRTTKNKLDLGLKLTSMYQSGNNISAAGIGDLFLSTAYPVSEKTQMTLGFKISLSDGNKKKNGLPLPMDYQASLGTFDLIFGIGYVVKKIQLVAAIQQPLSQNKNTFFAEDYPMSSVLRTFPSTNNFKRSGDILLRASYPIEAGKKVIITPGILPIYHLANDKYTDKMGMEKEITGSQGLTFNTNIFLDFLINENNILQLNAGGPIIDRDVKPEGLGRRFVITLEYKIRF